jgi:hypothetical protein
MGLGFAGFAMLLLCVVGGLFVSEFALRPELRVTQSLLIPVGALAGGVLVWIVAIILIPHDEWCGYYPLGNPVFFVVVPGSYIGYLVGAAIGFSRCIVLATRRKGTGRVERVSSEFVPVLVFVLVLAFSPYATVWIPAVLAELGLSPC